MRAMAADGIVLMLTAIEALIGIARSGGAEAWKDVQPVVAKYCFRCHGETKQQARDAADALVVDYEVKPAAVSLKEAVKPGAPQVWEQAKGNICYDWGLGDKAAAWPDELSGGQQQRVAIARTMIGLPDLIIADEPTSALDRVSGRLVVDQLKDLAMRAKCAVVLSTHDERIFDVASRRLHIEDGRCFDVPIHYH